MPHCLRIVVKIDDLQLLAFRGHPKQVKHKRLKWKLREKVRFKLRWQHLIMHWLRHPREACLNASYLQDLSLSPSL